jgi:uncharacterized protein YuzE
MDFKLIIRFDPDADAIYVQVAESPSEVGETVVDECGVIIDTDLAGRPIGYEFLQATTRGIPMTTLPVDVAAALQAFIDSGALSSTNPVESELR